MKKETTTIHMLLVDDNPRYLDRLEKYFSEQNYLHLTPAASVTEAKQKLKETLFDIIIADMRMETNESGFDILKEVKERNLSSVVIILTANDTVADCRKALKEGAWDYISKNIPGNVLKEVHQSIQQAITYLNRWGNKQDKSWIDENKEDLLKKHQGQYIAVLNNNVIAVGDSEKAIVEELQQKNLPRFLTVIQKIEAPIPTLKNPLSAKLTIFVEGPTDVSYIRTALKLQGRQALEDNIYLDNIGNLAGNEWGGYQSLKHAFDFLKVNPKFRPEKVLFLYDQDIQKHKMANKGQDFENLFVRSIADYDKEKAGIEYLFKENILEEGILKGFVTKNLGTITATNPNPTPTYKIITTQKTAFCTYICEQRNSTPEDFAAFANIIAIIDELLA